jgi:hypothetical protein
MKYTGWPKNGMLYSKHWDIMNGNICLMKYYTEVSQFQQFSLQSLVHLGSFGPNRAGFPPEGGWGDKSPLK